MTLAAVEASFCVRLSLSVCHFLSQALFSSAQMISIYLSFFFFLSPLPECQPRASARHSKQKPPPADCALWFACSPHISTRMLSEPCNYDLEKEMSDSHSVFGGGWHFGICCFYTQSPSKLSSCQKILQIICVCSSYFFFLFNSVIFTQLPSFRIIFFTFDLITKWTKIPARSIKTLFRFHNLLISLITMIV